MYFELFTAVFGGFKELDRTYSSYVRFLSDGVNSLFSVTCDKFM